MTAPDHAREKTAVALSSMAASLAMTIGKFIVGLLTGSLGLLSEGLHSLLDFGATVMTFMAVRVSDKPADAEHHYGHGKIEAVAALAETALLFLTSAWIVYEAIHRLLAPKIDVEARWWSFAVVAAAIIIDIWRARALKRTAEKTKSMALEADALHFSSDVLSSTVVLIGLGFVALGWPKADPVAAIGVAVFVCRAGWRLGRRTFDTLIDTAPHGAAEAIAALVRAVPGVAGVARLRVRPAGSVFFVEVEAAIGRGLALNQVASLKNAVADAIRSQMPEAEITVSTRPLKLDDETIHQRAMIIAAGHGAHVHHITAHHVGAKLSLSFDLEVDGALALAEAHRIASALEADMRGEFGADTEVEAHIEPLADATIAGEEAAPAERAAIAAALERLAAGSALSDIHDVRARRTAPGLIVIFHCRTAPERTVAEIHRIVDDLERDLRKAVPGIWRTVAHAEPAGEA